MKPRDSLNRPNSGFAHLDRGAEFDCYVTFMVSKPFLAELTSLARARNVSRAELIRTYCTWGMENDSGGTQDSP